MTAFAFFAVAFLLEAFVVAGFVAVAVLAGARVAAAAAYVADWGFAVEEVRVPTKWLLGAQDTSVPPSHGAWLQEHLPTAEVMVKEGGHFGPFGDLEMDLLIWAGRGTPEDQPTRHGG